MKKRLLSLILCAAMALTGCSGFLERDFVSVTPHNSTITDAGTSSILRVENYQELVNTMIHFITTGADSGTVRLYMDAAQVEDHLREARQEILTKYPMGAYAVYNINYEVDPLVTYSEARLRFIYRRSQAQIASIIPVTGITAIRSELTKALSSYTPQLTLRITYFDQGADYIQNLIRQAYYASPGSALEFPRAEIRIYPDSGKERIVEIGFAYDQTQDQLLERAILLQQACRRMADNMPLLEPTAADVGAAIMEQAVYDPEGGASAYHALLEGSANCEGIALAMGALCQQFAISCRVARGLLNGEPWFWVTVSTEWGWRHLDLTQPTPTLSTDEEWLRSGYLWDATTLPACS